MKMASKNRGSKKLSKLISRSLILTGLGKCMTKLSRNKSLVLDQLHYRNNGSEMFDGGSMAEGTMTPGSDFDRMIVVPGMVVTTSDVIKIDSERECDIFLLDASQSSPGYARLRLLMKTHKESSLFHDCDISLQDVLEETKEGIFLSSEKFVNSLGCILKQGGIFEEHYRHGPCLSAGHVNTHGLSEGITGFSTHLDIAFALSCFEWPDEEKSWITRKRPYNWPPKSLIEKIRNKKCYVVPVGNPQSKHYALEWRISYLLSERELVWSFNDTQIHCFFLLKRLLKLYMETIAPDQLSSYHIKTVLFWLSEETGLSMWYPENLISCLEVCLDKMLDCVKQKKLFHYFNCHANLFDHKFQNDIQRALMLETILSIRTHITLSLLTCLPQVWEWPRLWDIKSSVTFNLSKISRCTDYYKLENYFTTRKQAMEAFYVYRVMFCLFLHVTCMWGVAKCPQIQCLLFQNNQIEGANSLFIEITKLFLDIRFAMAYFRQITIHEDKAFQTYINSKPITSAGILQMASDACMIDDMSGKLYLATLYHFLGDYIMSTMIVNALLRKRMYLVYPGYCSIYTTIHLRGGFSKQKHGMNFLDTEGRTSPAYDVIFSYKDIYCVPYPLKFECAISEFETDENLILIHPCVYAYFLLCYGQYISKDLTSFKHNLAYLDKAVNETKGGVARHVALNILSYCYVLDGNLQKAFEYFTESFLFTEKRGYVWSAAAFHIAILVLKRLEK